MLRILLLVTMASALAAQTKPAAGNAENGKKLFTSLVRQAFVRPVRDGSSLGEQPLDIVHPDRLQKPDMIRLQSRHHALAGGRHRGRIRRIMILEKSER